MLPVQTNTTRKGSPRAVAVMEFHSGEAEPRPRERVKRVVGPRGASIGRDAVSPSLRRARRRPACLSPTLARKSTGRRPSVEVSVSPSPRRLTAAVAAAQRHRRRGRGGPRRRLRGRGTRTDLLHQRGTSRARPTTRPLEIYNPSASAPVDLAAAGYAAAACTSTASRHRRPDGAAHRHRRPPGDVVRPRARLRLRRAIQAVRPTRSPPATACSTAMTPSRWSRATSSVDVIRPGRRRPRHRVGHGLDVAPPINTLRRNVTRADGRHRRHQRVRPGRRAGPKPTPPTPSTGWARTASDPRAADLPPTPAPTARRPGCDLEPVAVGAAGRGVAHGRPSR